MHGMKYFESSHQRHVEAVEADIGIVIVKIRNALFLALLAAVFADIVAGGRTRYEAEVDGNLEESELAGQMHGDIVDAGDVAQGVERR